MGLTGPTEIQIGLEIPKRVRSRVVPISYKVERVSYSEAACSREIK